MSSILKLLSLLGGIVPIVLILIKEFETPGFGAEKKKVILDCVGLFYDKMAEGNALPITKEKLLSITGSLINIVVAFYNLVGWFKHKNPTVSS